MKRHIFQGREDGPHLLITGGVHGDEFEPIAAIRRLVSMFQTNESEPAGLTGQLTLVPIVNQAAFLRGHRCAEDGLEGAEAPVVVLSGREQLRRRRKGGNERCAKLGGVSKAL